ncbi:GH39 family glycosyl hydrolase [Tundrisphaera sp. TA3]|uniref:GH39 family glycosyl hydrolase n=1 Tax=Tundrisphaera sp. TA3 TaxID=3435775 RepID=UPI003EBCC33F
MASWTGRGFPALLAFGLMGQACPAAAGPGIKIVEKAPDPHGSPRPARGAIHVPLKTSLYLELATDPKAADAVDPGSIAVVLGDGRGPVRELLREGSRFVGGASGWIRPTSNLQGEAAVAVYIETGIALEPLTAYTASASARSRSGAVLADPLRSWTFTTEEAPRLHPVAFQLDLSSDPIRWQGGFFTGFGNIAFCTTAKNFGPTYELMAEARKAHPRAWSYQRDFWMTGTDFRPPGLLGFELPNIVRERETRRIAAIETAEGETVLRVEDVFGGHQYGIEPGRPISGDYHPGDEVLIADGIADATARVIAVDDRGRSVRVTPIKAPPGGWKLDYEAPLPTVEDPDKPGLFARGGCYLRKLRPHGTPCYYWGRLDKEWDLAHRRYGRRLLPNFADAPGDLARDGRSWTTAKDLAEWHEVAREIAGHVIDRYGEESLAFTWSIFNEPDLGPLFWRADWDELQRFYDYAVDGILRAFEDRGYDSDRVFIGGLELGGIFGTHLKLNEFLAHCSPRAKAPGALPLNAAYADARLDGKRSRRVEALCKAHGGKGSPCDFVSIHAYNGSAGMAAKLIRAKEMALAVDPEFYRDLWVNSHENCPDWLPPPDEAAADSYLGNGFFPTWCVDVVRRQLRKAAEDPRFRFGESILTVWPPNQDLGGLNAVTRILHADDDGDGKADRDVTIPMPIFHAFGLLSDLSDRFWALPEQVIGGQVVSGFASREGDTTRVVLYAHHGQDTQSRSDAEFEVALDLAGLAGPTASVREFRFDRSHNSYYQEARAIRSRRESTQADPATIDALVKKLGADDPAVLREAFQALGKLGPSAHAAVGPLMARVGRLADEGLKAEGGNALAAMMADAPLRADDVERLRSLSELRPTAESTHQIGDGGLLQLKVRVGGNGVNFLIIGEKPRDRP